MAKGRKKAAAAKPKAEKPPAGTKMEVKQLGPLGRHGYLVSIIGPPKQA